MAGKYTEFEKQTNGVRIVLLPEARTDVEDIAAIELDADSKLSEVIEWQRVVMGTPRRDWRVDRCPYSFR